jgi:hypothetical protein
MEADARMKELGLSDESLRGVEARVMLEGMEWSERRRQARTSEDTYLLIALSEPDREWDDPDIIENLLENQHTPREALRNVADRKRPEGDEKLERWARQAIQHPNADSSLLAHLSDSPNWTVRYTVAMRQGTSHDVLKKLSDDPHLTVRAIASRKLGVAFIEGLGVGTLCTRLNEVFDKVRGSISTSRDDVSSLVEPLGIELDRFSDRYDPFYQVFGKFDEALDALRTRLVDYYERRLHATLIPNINLEHSDFAELMKKFGKDHFDAFIIAGEIKALFDQRGSLSLNQILSDARNLLPYVSDASRIATGACEWGPASKPEHVLRGKRLELRFHRFHTYGDDNASVDSEGMPQLSAIDQLSQVILQGADPSTATSNVPEILFAVRTASGLFRKIKVGWGSPIEAIRIFKSGRFDVAYATEEDARKVAAALVEPARRE